jgi:hypothetical protein
MHLTAPLEIIMTNQEAKSFLKGIVEKYYSPGGEALIPLIERAQSVLSPELDKAARDMELLVAQYRASHNDKWLSYDEMIEGIEQQEALYDRMVEAVAKHTALEDLFLL